MRRIQNYFLESRLQYLFFFVILLIGILFARNIFKEGIPITWDHPWHFSHLSQLINSFLPNGFIFGWDSKNFLGHPTLLDFTPFPYLLMAFMYYLSLGQISIIIVYKIFLVISYIIPGVGLFFFMKKFGYSSAAALSAFLFALILDRKPLILGGDIYQIVELGTMLHPMSLGFTFFSLAFLHEAVNQRKRSSIILAAIFLASAILTHVVAAYMTALFSFIYFFVYIIKNRINHDLKGRDFFIYARILVLSSFLTAFWSIPFIWFIRKGWRDGIILDFVGSGIFEGHDVMILALRHMNTIIAILTFLGIIYVVFKHQLQGVLIIIFLAISELLALNINLYGISMSWLPFYKQIHHTDGFMRFFPYARLFLILFAGVGFGLIFNLYRSLRTVMLKYLLIIILLLVMGLILYKQVRQPIFLRTTENINQSIYQEISFIVNWIKLNMEDNTRVLIQDTASGTIFKEDDLPPSHVPYLISSLSQKSIVGGGIQTSIVTIPISYTEKHRSLSYGFLFKTLMTNEDSFIYAARNLGIGYIISYSPDIQGKLSSSKNFYNVFMGRFFSIYRIKGEIGKIVEIDNKNFDFENLYLKDNEIVARIRNKGQASILRLKMPYYYNWNAYSDGKKIRISKYYPDAFIIEPEEQKRFFPSFSGLIPFMWVNIDKNDKEIVFKYEKDIIEYLGLFISILTIAFIILEKKLSIFWYKKVI